VVGQDGLVWTGRVRQLSKEDADGCDATIRSLPYFFGQEGGIADCARAVRSHAGLVAVDDAGTVLGFLTHESHYPLSAEITWMAVRQGFRRIGIGRRLIARLADDASGAGLHILFVITLGPSALEPGVIDGYGGTREFYERTGFVPLKELDAWGPDSPGLVLARPIYHREPVAGPA
jgi:GNAT superfamily N-acetyltransferase